MEEVVSIGEGDPEIIHLPPGFRFHPTDEEIITHYLAEKAMNRWFSAAAIGEVDLNKCEPWDLHTRAKMGEKEWYFFSQKDRKYPTGMRTNRATESGYWKATGKDKGIFRGRNCLVGMKKTLVFYLGRAPKGEKTNWVMHEYRLEGKFSYPNLRKDEWVVCRIYHKTTGMKKPTDLIIPGMPRFNTWMYGDLSSDSLPPLVEPASASAGPSSSFGGDGTDDELKRVVGDGPFMPMSRSSNANFPYWSSLPFDPSSGLKTSGNQYPLYQTLDPNSNFSILNDEVHDHPNFSSVVVQGSAINPTYLNRSMIGSRSHETDRSADMNPEITSSSATTKQELATNMQTFENQIGGSPFVGPSDSSDILGFTCDY
ncbi:hypothetical protein SAY87_017639 [Trapa incisa]|uniref:NAC domain-containing protein n=1 Tax=Trapa incisa TaxID=236973 RepID=A0AAN7QT47_9MYRT|nr:hypothetical protein SAY87_017639 [Trapa incisa]